MNPLPSPSTKNKIDLKALSQKLCQINLKEEEEVEVVSTASSSPTLSTTSATSPRLKEFVKSMKEDGECLADVREWPSFREDICSITGTGGASSNTGGTSSTVASSTTCPSSSTTCPSTTSTLRPLHFSTLNEHYTLIRQQTTSPTDSPSSTLAHSRIKELRVAVIGNVDAGKSTLLAVLSRGWLDDGRGGARGACARHGHERETGRTSSVNQELLGFRIDGTCMYSQGGVGGVRSQVSRSRCGSKDGGEGRSRCGSKDGVSVIGRSGSYCKDEDEVNDSTTDATNPNTDANTNPNTNANTTLSTTSTNTTPFANPSATPLPMSQAAKVDWEAWIGRDSWKCVSLIDLAGHERYLKTTMFGLTGFCPDMAIFLVAANAGGLVGMSKEHLALIAALGLPLIVVVTKVDLAPEGVKAATLASLMKAIKGGPCRKTPFLVKSVNDLGHLIHSGLFGSNAVAPVLEVSNVTGQGIDLLRGLLNLAPVPDAIKQRWSEARDSPLEYQINETYTVPGVGTVVSGVMLAGRVRVGDQVLLGPLSNGTFLSTQIKGIQRKRVTLNEAVAGQGVSFALKKVRRGDVRYGMVLIAAGDSHVRVCREFTAQVLILYHSTTITPKYQAMLHCGSIRQTVQIVSMEVEEDGEAGEQRKEAAVVGRSGDRARIRFKFLKNPEMMQCGQRVLFREGRIRGIGRVIQLH